MLHPDAFLTRLNRRNNRARCTPLLARSIVVEAALTVQTLEKIAKAYLELGIGH
jgi:hypothetical protein